MDSGFKRKTHELGSNNSGGLGKDLKGGREGEYGQNILYKILKQ